MPTDNRKRPAGNGASSTEFETDALQSSASALMRGALVAAQQGWAVHPCVPVEDDPRFRDKHGNPKTPKAPILRHGLKDASTDLATVARWWVRWPDAMIGAVVPDSLLVIDVDPYHGGSLAALQQVSGALPPTVTVWSGRDDGGRHLYFRRPAALRPVSTRLPEGIDLRTNRHYCIFPPSLHFLTGQPYRWGEAREFAPLPEGLRRLLTPPPPPVVSRPVSGAVNDRQRSGLVRTVAAAKEGERNKALFWAANRAAEAGVLPQLAGELVAAAESVGLPPSEARRTVESAARTSGVTR